MLGAGQVVASPTQKCWEVLLSNPRYLVFMTSFRKAKAGRTRLIPDVVSLVTVGAMVNNILFVLILDKALLCFMGSAANPTSDGVYIEGLGR